MKPIRTATMPITYLGPASDIGDLPCERMQPGQIRTVWEPSDIERELIAGGASIEVVLFTEPIPPIAVGISTEGPA